MTDISDIQSVTDWIEARVFNKSEVSQAELRRMLAMETEEGAEEINIALSSAYQQIKYRRRIAGPTYPFRVEHPTIVNEKEPCSEYYKFLFLLEYSENFREKKAHTEPGRMFDDLVELALRKYMADGGKVLRFAWPPATGDRPGDFEAALDTLCAALNLPRGPGKNSHYLKDGGVDFVAWKTFPDDREAYMLMYVQCTIQSDWFVKAKDALPSVWLGRVDSGVQALACIAVPFNIPSSFERWDELRRTLHIVFERFRLAKYLMGEDPSRVRGMVEWSTNELLQNKLEALNI